MKLKRKDYKILINILDNSEHLSEIKIENLRGVIYLFENAIDDCLADIEASFILGNIFNYLAITTHTKKLLRSKIRYEFLKKLAKSDLVDEILTSFEKLEHVRTIVRKLQYSKRQIPEYKKKRMSKKEERRLFRLTMYEREAHAKGFNFIAGIDEAGRGCLAGPVVAAACIVPSGLFLPGVNDSKQLTPEERSDLFAILTENPRIYYGIGVVEQHEIDTLNIYHASELAFFRAVENLKSNPDLLFVDGGVRLKRSQIPVQKIIGGDGLSQSIAAASIIAKVTRDRIMSEYHDQWPEYGFKQHKGYSTLQHIEALEKHGPCKLHRNSFDPVRRATQMLTVPCGI